MKKFIQYCKNNPAMFLVLAGFPLLAIWAILEGQLFVGVAFILLTILIVIMCIVDYTQNPNKAKKGK